MNDKLLRRSQQLPPAFPLAGMTLRDWFAGMALANPRIGSGRITDGSVAKLFPDRASVTGAELAAKRAYMMADAMMEARNAK